MTSVASYMVGPIVVVSALFDDVEDDLFLWYTNIDLSTSALSRCAGPSNLCGLIK